MTTRRSSCERTSRYRHWDSPSAEGPSNQETVDVVRQISADLAHSWAIGQVRNTSHLHL